MHESLEALHETPFSSASPILRHIGRYAASRGEDFPPHQHGCWELVFYRRGFIEAPIGNQTHRTRPGLLLLTPPDTTHAERAVSDYANIHAEVEASPRHPWPREVHDDAHGTFAALFGALEREVREPQSDSSALIALLMAQLDLLLRREHERQAPSSEASRRVREAEILWDDAPHLPWSVENTAKRLGTTPSQLRVRFASVRAQSPSQVLREIRVRHALARLRESSASLQIIAQECGFHSASHLSRHIKTATGQAPGFWRATRKASPE